MNPNVVRLIKGLSILAITMLLVAAAYLMLRQYTDLQIDSFLVNMFYLFIGLLVGGMLLLIIRVVLRMIWPTIINRSETINFCCPDKNGQGIHLVGDRYNTGGKFTKGYRSYSHYYLKADGKMFLSRKFNPTRPLDSLEDLAQQAQTPLAYDQEKQISVGYYQDVLKSSKNLSLRDVDISIEGVEGWIDYGFKISIRSNDRLIWTGRI